MKPINIYTFSRLPNAVDETLINQYLTHISNQKRDKNIKDYEYQSLVFFVNSLISHNKMSVNEYDNFYFGFSIPQISKEFDLLKLGNNGIVNIELKSSLSNYSKITTQLKNNRYYLSHLSLPIFSFTYTADTNKLYTLNNEGILVETTFDVIITTIKSLRHVYSDHLEKKFEVSNFLVSPINTPDIFIKGEYFLTNHQQVIKDDILSKGSGAFQIMGSAGTGKTLLLYDIAKEAKSKGNVLIIHAGLLANGHDVIKRKLPISLISIKSVRSIDFTVFKYIFIDEAHRIRTPQYEAIMSVIDLNNQSIIFSVDSNQILSREERENATFNKIATIPNINNYTLTNKIRTNKGMANFIRALLDLNHKADVIQTDNISVLYAPSVEIAKVIIDDLMKNQNFTFINYTPGKYRNADWQKLPQSTNSHKVIGQEFDNVVITMGNQFKYNSSGTLLDQEHPNPNYLYARLLYQQITRVRTNLCIVVYSNLDLFKKILSIFSS